MSWVNERARGLIGLGLVAAILAPASPAFALPPIGNGSCSAPARAMTAEEAEVIRTAAVAAEAQRQYQNQVQASQRRLAALAQQIEEANARDRDFQTRGVPLGAYRSVRQPDGTIIDYDTDDRVVMTTTPQGLVTWVGYNAQGQVNEFGIRQPGESRLQEMHYTLRGDIARGGRGTFEVWRGSTHLPNFTGSVVIVNGTPADYPVGTFILVERNTVTAGLPNGSTSVETGSVRRTTSGDGRAVRIEESGAQNPNGTRHYRIVTDLQQDAAGPSRVVLGGHSYTRVGDPLANRWTVDGNPRDIQHRAFQFQDNRIVATVWNAEDQRTITETRITGHSVFEPQPNTVVYNPDTNPQHAALEAQRQQYIQMGLVPATITPGQFQELYVEAMVTRARILEQMIQQRSFYLDDLRRRRILDSGAYDTAMAEIRRLQAMVTNLGSAIEPGRGIVPQRIDPARVDYSRFAELSRGFFDPDHPENNPFGNVDRLLEQYRTEIPGFGESTLAVVRGAGRAVQGIVQDAANHPLQTAGIVILTIAFPEVMVPALTAVGVVRGGVVVGTGIHDIVEGRRTGNAATYLHGWEQVGSGGTEIGVSVGGYYLYARGRAAAGARSLTTPGIEPVRPVTVVEPVGPPPNPNLAAAEEALQTARQLIANGDLNGARLPILRARRALVAAEGADTAEVARVRDLIETVTGQREGAVIHTQAASQAAATLRAGRTAGRPAPQGLSAADVDFILQSDRNAGLAFDPSHGFTPGTVAEARAGLAAERLGVIPGPVRRSVSPQGRESGLDFVDSTGTHWDMVRGLADLTQGPAEVLAKVRPARPGATCENALVDMTGLDAGQAQALIQAIQIMPRPAGSGAIRFVVPDGMLPVSPVPALPVIPAAPPAVVPPAGPPPAGQGGGVGPGTPGSGVSTVGPAVLPGGLMGPVLSLTAGPNPQQGFNGDRNARTLPGAVAPGSRQTGVRSDGPGVGTIRN